jgi:hypothetical protein
MPGSPSCHAIFSQVKTVLHGETEYLSRFGCERRAVQFKIMSIATERPCYG